MVRYILSLWRGHEALPSATMRPGKPCLRPKRVLRLVDARCITLREKEGKPSVFRGGAKTKHTSATSQPCRVESDSLQRDFNR